VSDYKHTDLKFFTNEPGESLLDRFVKTLEYAQYFDVLVGLNADKKAYNIIQTPQTQQIHAIR